MNSSPPHDTDYWDRLGAPRVRVPTLVVLPRPEEGIAVTPTPTPYDLRRERRLVRTETLLIQAQSASTVLCGTCWVVDGDTIVINNVHLRLAGIDAPELDQPHGKNAKYAMVQLCKGQMIRAHIKPELSHDRLVAECFLEDGRDLAAELVKLGLAIDWPKFSGGKYAQLEPVGVRRKLWRCEARQRGRLIP